MRPENRVPYLHGRGEDFDPVGQQQANLWPAGDASEKPLLTTEPGPFPWRVSVFGDLLLTVQWGTSSTLVLNNVRAPLVAVFPGRVSVTARARDAALGASGYCTLQQATAGLAAMHLLQTLAGAFPFCAVAVSALNAVTLDIAGTAVVLAAGQRVPVTGSSSSLVAGAVMVECAP